MNVSKKVVAALLIFVTLVLLNIAGNFIPFKVDWTEDKIFTLSDGSRSLLSKISEPIQIEFYFSRGADVPLVYKNYATRIEDMLKQYVSESNGMLTLEVIDPEPDSKEEEQAARAGIEGQDLPNGERFYFGMAVIQFDQNKNIPFFNINSESFLEHDISKLIYSVQQYEKPTLGIFSPSLKAFGGPPAGPQAPQQSPWMVFTQLENTFDVEQLTEASEITDALDLLFVLHPSPTTPEIEYAIDQFIMSGKPTIIAVDPLSAVAKESTPRSPYSFVPPGGVNQTSDLPTLFAHYGIEYDPDKITADVKNAAQLGGRTGRRFFYPGWIILPEESLNKEFVPTALLQELLVAEAGHFELADNSPLKLEALIQSSNETGVVTGDDVASIDSNPGSLIQKVEPTGQAYTLAGHLTGKLTTAFPDGKPASDDKDESGEEEAPEDKPEESQVHLAESKSDVNIMLFADSDWLFDRFCFQISDFLGQQIVQPINDNYALVANITDFFSGSSDLLSIRGKRKTTRSFEVVEQINIEAEKRYQKALNKLDEEIAEVQTKLSEMQSQQSQRGVLTIDSEMKQAIKEFQDKEVELRGERREIRKKAREDVEALERKILVANILSVPALVALCGFIFLMRRYRNR